MHVAISTNCVTHHIHLQVTSRGVWEWTLHLIGGSMKKQEAEALQKHYEAMQDCMDGANSI